MTPEELKQVKEVIHTTIDDRHKDRDVLIEKALDRHMTSDHHRFVEAKMLEEERKLERLERIKGNFFFWLLITCTSAIGFAVWEYLKTSINGSGNAP